MEEEKRTEDSSEQKIHTQTEKTQPAKADPENPDQVEVGSEKSALETAEPEKVAPLFPKLPAATPSQRQKLPPDMTEESAEAEARSASAEEAETGAKTADADYAEAVAKTADADDAEAGGEAVAAENAEEETAGTETPVEQTESTATEEAEVDADSGDEKAGKQGQSEQPQQAGQPGQEGQPQQAKQLGQEGQPQQVKRSGQSEQQRQAGQRGKASSEQRKLSLEEKERLSRAKKQRDYQERIRRHRRKIRGLCILVASLAVAFVIILAWYMTHRSYSRAEFSKTVDFVSEEGASYANLDGYVVQYGPNGASCVNRQGSVSWSITFEMDRPIISTAGEVIALADYGGRTIYLMNSQKQLGTITTSLPIHALAVSESEEVAAVLDDADSSWIRLYDASGQEIAYFVRDMEENGYPLAVAISPDGAQVCVSSLLLRGTSVKSNLSFYNFGREGRAYDQNRVGDFEFTDEIFPYIRFLSDGRCAAVSDSRLVIYDTSSTETQNGTDNMFSESLQGVFCSDRYVGLLFTDETGENLYTLDVYGRDGAAVGEIGFSMSYTNLQIVGDKIYINSDQSMQIYSVHGREIFDGGLDQPVKALIPTARLRGLFAVTKNEMDAINLH